MAERLLAKGEKGQHQCNTCLKLFDFIGNGEWIPTTCPECAKKPRFYMDNCTLCGVSIKRMVGVTSSSDDFCLKCWGELHGINP